MKKIFIFVLLLLLVPAICLAEPQVTSENKLLTLLQEFMIFRATSMLKLVTESSPAMPHGKYV